MPRKKQIKYNERFTSGVWGVNKYSEDITNRYLFIIIDNVLRNTILPKEQISKFDLNERRGTCEEIADEMVARLNFEVCENEGLETDQTELALKIHKELYDRKRI